MVGTLIVIADVWLLGYVGHMVLNKLMTDDDDQPKTDDKKNQ